MTRTADLVNGRLGALILSPAVTPSPKPISSADGMATEPSVFNQKGNTDQRSDAQTQNVDPNSPVGLATVQFDGPPPGFKWRVERMSIGSSDAATFTECEVHAGHINPENRFLTLVDQTPVPAVSIADESSPVFVGPGQPLTFLFFGGTAPDDNATARIQYTLEAL